MTALAYAEWLASHYGELVAVAKRRVSVDAEDVVQSAVLRVWRHEHYARFDRPWTWMVNAVRSMAGHARVSETRRERLRGAWAQAMRVQVNPRP